MLPIKSFPPLVISLKKGFINGIGKDKAVDCQRWTQQLEKPPGTSGRRPARTAAAARTRRQCCRLRKPWGKMVETVGSQKGCLEKFALVWSRG